MDKVLYAGVDAHKATSHITVMDEAGRVLKRKQVPSSLAGLRQALGRYQEPMKAVLEASYSWGPMYDWLDEIADEVVLAHPAQVKAIAAARIKTDRIDSETLAHLLRADLIPVAYAPSKKVRATKRVLRHRMFLVRVRTMVKNRIRALLSQHAVALPELSDLYGKTGLRWLGQVQLPDLDGRLLRDDIKLLVQLTDAIASTDNLIEELANGDDVVKWLASLPGIGTFLSVLIRYEVDDIRRFREPKKFAGYTGLVPSTYASGPRMMRGALTKRGNKWLRWAFVEAVTPAIRTSPSLRRYYERIKTRRGTKDARVSTARKLAELAWTMWTEHRSYLER